MKVNTPWDVKQDQELKAAILAKCDELVNTYHEVNCVKFFYTHDGPNDSIIVTTIFYEGEFLAEDWIRVLNLF